MNTYTQEEILKNISLFQEIEDELIYERKEINKKLIHARSQKNYWIDLYKSQLKLL